MGIRTAPEVLDKTPEEEVVRFVEFAGVGLSTGEVISSILSVTVDPNDSTLNILSQTFSGTVAQLKIGAGTLGANYVIHVQVLTDGGQKPVVCCRLKVRAC